MKRQRGYTIVELIIAIIGVVGALGLITMFGLGVWIIIKLLAAL